MEAKPNYKEVYFDEYCKTCEHLAMDDTEEPCTSCLNEPVNLGSHKPVKHEERSK